MGEPRNCRGFAKHFFAMVDRHSRAWSVDGYYDRNLMLGFAMTLFSDFAGWAGRKNKARDGAVFICGCIFVPLHTINQT